MCYVIKQKINNILDIWTFWHIEKYFYQKH